MLGWSTADRYARALVQGGSLIPTLILLGLILGHWWRWTLPAAAVGWSVLLAASEVTTSPLALLAGAALAVVNTGLGVLIYLTVRSVVGAATRRVRA